MPFISDKTSIFLHSWVPGIQTLGTRTTLLTFFPPNTGLLVQPWTEEHTGTPMSGHYEEKMCSCWLAGSTWNILLKMQIAAAMALPVTLRYRPPVTVVVSSQLNILGKTGPQLRKCLHQVGV